MARTRPHPQRIATPDDIAVGVQFLVRRCPAMARAHALVGDPPLRRWSPGFDGLVRIVTGQQLSIASAAAIFGRLQAAVTPLDAAGVRLSTDDTLRDAGLSAAKIATLRRLSDAVLSGSLDLEWLQHADGGAVREQLLLITGIGPWTADLYLLFGRGDADAFAPGDLALQVGVARLFDLADRPSAQQLAVLAERWRPWRGVAARLIWAFYAVDQRRI